jgi:hypothetical protein
MLFRTARILRAHDMSELEARGSRDHERAWRPAVRQERF